MNVTVVSAVDAIQDILEQARFASSCCDKPDDRMWHAEDNTWWRREGNQWKSAGPPPCWVEEEP